MELIIVIGAVLLLVATAYAVQAIINDKKSPLSKIPNAGFGSQYSRLLWAFRHEYRGTITLDLPLLHKKLGPLVRISPNEISFYSIDIYDAVHKIHSGYVKDPRVYGQFVQDGHPALFSITHPQAHFDRRKLMGQLFNRSKMSNLESLMLSHVNTFTSVLLTKKSTVDLNSGCRALEADIISSFSFGEPLNAILSWSRGKDLPMVAKNDEKATWMPVLVDFPAACEAWEQLEAVVYHLTGLRSSYRYALDEFDKWTDTAWKAVVDLVKPSHSTVPNLINVLVHSGLPSETALSEAKETLGPGTDTTSGSLAHIIFALGWNTQYQDALYEDLRQVGFSTDMSVLENIPRLRACVKEGIRWGGTAAAMLPRVVPEGGVELCGKYIPQGTVLTSSPIWYLRDEEAFPSPDLFDPYRWIDNDGSSFKEDTLRDQFYIPFSKGTNTCIGIHFSYYELYLSISQLIKSTRIHSVTPSRGSTNPNADTNWIPVTMPERKEWVAAVLKDKLLVNLEARV